MIISKVKNFELMKPFFDFWPTVQPRFTDIISLIEKYIIYITNILFVSQYNW